MNSAPPQHHSLENLEKIVSACAAHDLDAASLGAFTQVLVKHGHPLAAELLDRWEAKIDIATAEPDIAAEHVRLARYRAAFTEIIRSFRFEELSRDALDLLYRPYGSLYLKKPDSRNLLVLFGTMYNNFGGSYAAMAALLRQVDCSLLFMKDGYSFYFFKGVKGFASSLADIPVQVRAFAQREGIERIGVTAYSSGGRGGLSTALALDCPYVGMSQKMTTDKATGAPSNIDRMVDELKVIDRSEVADFSEVLPVANPAVPRRLYFGMDHPRDAYHAGLVTGLPTIDVIGLPDTGHDSVIGLIAQRAFVPAMNWLFASGGQPQAGPALGFSHLAQG